MANATHNAELALNTEGTEELERLKEAAEGAKEGVEELANKAEEATAATEEMGNAARGAAQNTENLGASTAQASSASRDLILKQLELGQKVAGAASAIQGLVGQLGIQGGAAGMIASMVQAGVAGAQLGLALGPVGAGVGAAAGLLIPVLANLTTEINAEAEAHRHAQEAAADHLAVLRQLAESQMSAAEREAEHRRIASGDLSSESEANQILEDRARRIEVLTQMMGELDESTFGGGDRFTVQVRLAEMRAEIERLSSEALGAANFLEQEGLQQQLQDDIAVAGANSARRQGGTREAGPGLVNTDMNALSLQEGLIERLSLFGAGSQAETDLDLTALITPPDGEQGLESFLESFQKSIDEAANEQAQFAEQAKEASRIFSESWTGSVNDVIAAFEAQNRAAQKAGQTMATRGQLMENAARSVGNTVMEELGDGVSNAFAKSITAAITGAESFEKVMAKMLTSLLESLTQEAIVQGLKELALGIADTASYKYDSAAAHFAAAAAWGAVGVAAGVGLGAVSAASGGAGGGNPGANASQPEQRDDEQRGVIVNVSYNNQSYQTQTESDRMLRTSLERVGLGSRSR